MGSCQVDGCAQVVNKEGHVLCYEHWKAEKAGRLSHCEGCGKFKDDDKPLCKTCFRGKSRPVAPKGALSATQVGDLLGLSAQKTNLLLAELGWISKNQKGWTATRQGVKHGAIQKEHPQTGYPYVAWPDNIAEDRVLRRAAADIGAEVSLGAPDAPAAADEQVVEEKTFRDKYPPGLRTTDGHMVRSRAEVIIDNWLYQANIVHAYERRLPIEEEVYCDFYISLGDRVYIEFWGLEEDERYAARKRRKKEIYEKYQFNLIELNEKDLSAIDDVLPKRLLKFNVPIP